MLYEARFCKAWVGTWKFAASNDLQAWETVQGYIEEHVQTVYVGIELIHEVDNSGNPIRKLPPYENCLKIKNESLMLYKFYFNNKKNSYFVEAPDDVIAWSKVREKIKDYKIQNNLMGKAIEIDKIEEIDKYSGDIVRAVDSQLKCEKAKKESRDAPARKIVKKAEKAVYKAHFSNGECSGPYVAEVKEDDIEALEKGKDALKRHIEYNGLDIKKVKLIKIEELNENMNFHLNVERVQHNKNLANPKPEKKNRFIIG